MKVVSFIKVIFDSRNYSQEVLNFFAHRLSVSLVKCNEFVEDSFDGRTLKDIDFSRVNPESYQKIFTW